MTLGYKQPSSDNRIFA